MDQENATPVAPEVSEVDFNIDTLIDPTREHGRTSRAGLIKGGLTQEERVKLMGYLYKDGMSSSAALKRVIDEMPEGERKTKFTNPEGSYTKHRASMVWLYEKGFKKLLKESRKQNKVLPGLIPYIKAGIIKPRA